MRLLVTGFEPFLEHSTNPTMQILDAIQSDRVHTLVLPVEYERAADILIKTIKNESFDAALMLGLAADRTFVSLEYQALNLMDALAADNAGVRKRFEKITDGPESILSSLPVETLIGKKWRRKASLKALIVSG